MKCVKTKRNTCIDLGNTPNYIACSLHIQQQAKKIPMYNYTLRNKAYVLCLVCIFSQSGAPIFNVCTLIVHTLGYFFIDT